MISKRGTVRAAAVALACAMAALLALAGCSSGSPGSPAPSWASALGSGVTVVAPETAVPGSDSPGAALIAFIDASNAKKFTAICAAEIPSQQPKCRTVFRSASPSVIDPLLPFAKNAGLGYVAIHGTEALIGTTGEYCTPGAKPECFTNNDPAAILSSGKAFSALWKTTVAEDDSNSSRNVYTLFPGLEVGGKWYLDLSTGG